jgi:hypothetical protein
MTDSRFDSTPVRRARALLAAPPAPAESFVALTAAAGLFATAAMALAFAVVMMPTPWPR